MGDQERMVMENLRNTEWGRHWEQAPMMDSQVGVVMDLQWESHLVHNLDLREAPLVICKVENLRVQHGKSLLVQKLDLR